MAEVRTQLLLQLSLLAKQGGSAAREASPPCLSAAAEGVPPQLAPEGSHHLLPKYATHGRPGKDTTATVTDKS